MRSKEIIRLTCWVLRLKKPHTLPHIPVLRKFWRQWKRTANPKYTQEDLDLLARIIYAEAGCTWIPNWVQQLVGSVVLNRVASPYYPDTIRESDFTSRVNIPPPGTALSIKNRMPVPSQTQSIFWSTAVCARKLLSDRIPLLPAAVSTNLITTLYWEPPSISAICK